MSRPIEKFEQDGLAILLVRSSDAVVIRWQGISDARQPGSFLNPLLAQLTSDAAGSPVTVDLTGLEYINSATVSPLISFIKNLDAASSQVLVRFGKADWQQVHRRCMVAIARTLQHVEIEGES